MAKLTKRQQAGRANRRKRKGLTDEGRERLRAAALERRPWEHSTGPRTVEGKAIARGNAWKHGGRSWELLPDEVREAIEHLRACEAVGAASQREVIVTACEVLSAHGDPLRAMYLVSRHCRLLLRALR